MSEYVRACEALGWDLDTAWARVMDAVEGARLSDSERTELRARLVKESQALGLKVPA